MKLTYVDLCGFRGFSGPIRISFSETFTIIDGRNGVGKSTIFDAVEFALTGTISKYLDATAAGESVDDYLWWNGDSQFQGEYYVEVGFDDGEKQYAIKRTPFNTSDLDVSHVTEKLIDRNFAPKTAITQICAATIIRDEHIARLSLDLKEGERFTLLRDAIGAIDAEEWISKASRIVSEASKRVNVATSELDDANNFLANFVRQIDQIRSKLSESSLVGNAVKQLQSLLNTSAPADEIGDIARRRIAEIQEQLESLDSVLREWTEVDDVRDSVTELDKRMENAEVAWQSATENLETLRASLDTIHEATDLSLLASQLEGLANLGKEIGIRAGHCPLCNSEIDEEVFKNSLDSVLADARQIDAQAVEQAKKERALIELEKHVVNTKHALDMAIEDRNVAVTRLENLPTFLKAVDILSITRGDIAKHVEELKSENETISNQIKILDTISLNQVLMKTLEDIKGAKDRVKRVEERLGRVRLAEMRAKAIHDAVRRAAAESLDQRLDRVLPLMSELYKRLRPHPVWDDIEYSVRGDVRRFLKLQVGSGVNPQFVFSSGQRRATGLAFLLSMNLSIAWSRWHSILLDDPVQHVDDFRAIHLAEVLAHLCQSGRQIVCAVEDSALADLMCRRLSSSKQMTGKRVTLGINNNGFLSIKEERDIPPLQYRSLVRPQESLSA